VISRLNGRLNVAYKRTSQGVFCSDCSENWGGEFSSGILGNFHPALTHLSYNRETVDWKGESIGVHLHGYRLLVQVDQDLFFGLRFKLF
jgi:hypothetical protein